MSAKNSQLNDRVAVGTGKKAVKITLQKGKQSVAFRNTILSEIKSRVAKFRKTVSLFQREKAKYTEIHVLRTNFAKDRHSFELLLQLVNTYKKTNPVYLNLDCCSFQGTDLMKLLRQTVDKDGAVLLEGLTVDKVTLFEDTDILEYILEALKNANDLKLLYFKARMRTGNMHVSKEFFLKEKTIENLKFTTELANLRLNNFLTKSIGKGLMSLSNLHISSFDNSVYNAVTFFQRVSNGGDLLYLKIENLRFEKEIVKVIGLFNKSQILQVDINFQDSFEENLSPKLLLGSNCWKSFKFTNLKVDHVREDTIETFKFSSETGGLRDRSNCIKPRYSPKRFLDPRDFM
eukprot:snap_masked-scaffold_9-processed-gene-2.45-mRNA-1 protein AED:1.00 eAED:1.00 QI:0/-1/0/0/-1/1/1/0/345